MRVASAHIRYQECVSAESRGSDGQNIQSALLLLSSLFLYQSFTFPKRPKRCIRTRMRSRRPKTATNCYMSDLLQLLKTLPGGSMFSFSPLAAFLQSKLWTIICMILEKRDEKRFLPDNISCSSWATRSDVAYQRSNAGTMCSSGCSKEWIWYL